MYSLKIRKSYAYDGHSDPLQICIPFQYVEGTATAGRMVYKSVTSAKPDTAVKSSGGGGRYTNKMMKW